MSRDPARPPRVVAVWCPDWPVAAALLDADGAVGADPAGPTGGAGTTGPSGGVDRPAAVFVANRVVACSHTARETGIRRGMRRREAQARCPDLLVLPRAELTEIRAFEPVVRALESVAPGVEVTRPGLAAVGLAGPVRYFGGEQPVLHALTRAVAEHAPNVALSSARATGAVRNNRHVVDVLFGVADGSFAAEQAARRGVVVEPGGSPDFLAPLPIGTIDPAGASPLVDLLLRLGIRTLGAFAALPAADVLTRFGPDGAWAHRQAAGRGDRPVAGRRPARELTVAVEFEPAVDRVDTVAFSARGIGERFVTGLAAQGLACTCLEVTAVTENGEESVRRWRHTGVLGSVEVLDRVRWQLEGWLAATGHGGGAGHRPPTGGVVRVSLTPVETVPTAVHQGALWGGAGADDERAHRGLARVQTLLGHGSVLVPVVAGGRDPADRSELVPWGDEPVPTRSADPPWPGALPAPLPTVLLDPPQPVQVLDAAGRPVTVTDRGAVTAAPASLVGRDTSSPVTSWAGPWPVDERWWDPSSAASVAGLRSRFQLVDVAGRAFLASHRRDGDVARWTLDAVYD